MTINYGVNISYLIGLFNFQKLFQIWNSASHLFYNQLCPETLSATLVPFINHVSLDDIIMQEALKLLNS